MYLVQFLVRMAVVVVALGCASAARAEHLSAPAGAVILTIDGEMEQANTATGAEFDLEMLRQIGSVTFATSTPWTVGVQNFTGVPLNKLLAHIGATPSKLTIAAINEYSIEMPATDAVDGGPILAWDQNGKLLSVREKGPLWLIYPFDAKSSYQTEEIHSRAVWQVVHIGLKP